MKGLVLTVEQIEALRAVGAALFKLADSCQDTPEVFEALQEEQLLSPRDVYEMAKHYDALAAEAVDTLFEAEIMPIVKDLPEVSSEEE